MGSITPDQLVSPVSQVDSWGLSPMTAAELHQYQAEIHAAQANRGGGVLGAIAQHAPGFELVSVLGGKVQGVMDTVKTVAHASFESAKHIAKDTLNDVKDWANEHAEIIAGVAIVAGVAITAAALVATGPAALIVLGAVGNGLVSGGASIFTNKNKDGTVDWKAVFKDTLIGTESGVAGGTAVSAISKIGTVLNASRAMNTSVSATNALLKSENLAARSASASRINPMRYINSYRSATTAQKAERLYTSASKYSQTAAHYGDVGGFARSMTGQTAQSVATNVTSNNLAYAAGDFKEHTVGGYARATVSGIGVGVVSPRITPLRQNYISGSAPAQIAGYGVDRGRRK